MASVADICEFFFDLEEKYDLNYQKIQGCYPWQLIRLALYFEITKKVQLMGSGQQQTLSILDKFKSFIPFAKNSIMFDPFKGDAKDILIFDHPRKVVFNNVYVDIYSYFIVNYLKKNHSIEVIEFPYFNKHFTEKEDYIKYSDKIDLSLYVYKKFNKISFSDDEKDLILTVQKEIEETFNIQINLLPIFELHILNFKHDYDKYRKLFLKKKPKMIFIVVAYEKKAIVAAAKSLGIKVFELQHGTISNYHLGYSYPEKSRMLGDIVYFPDKILTFGNYWIDDDYCPISKENIVPIGFPYFEYQSKDFRDITPNSNQLLFISQGVVGNRLSEIAYELALECSDLNIIYKLHPGEFSTWESNYPKLVSANNLDNFQVVKNEISLYQLFAESNYQIGVCSTAMYEGLMFNCKTFVANLPCSEYMDDLIDERYVCKIDNVKELAEKIRTFEPTGYDSDFFFKDFDKQLLEKVIDNE